MDISLNICTEKPKVVKKIQPNNNDNAFTKPVDKESFKPKFFKKHGGKKPKIKNDNQPKDVVDLEKEDTDPKPFQKTFKQNKDYPLFSKKPKIRTDKIDRIQVQPFKEDLFAAGKVSFKELNIHDYIVQYMEKDNKPNPTYIQYNAIPKILRGENVMIRSQTGSGKTFAYIIPIVHALASITPRISRQDGMQVIVIVPTRELALQTFEEFRKMLNSFCWIVPGQVSGGEKRTAEKKRLKKGINILVGTPGRLMDHIKHTENFKLDKVRCLVVDEADSLVEHGYQEDVKSIIKAIRDAQKNDYNPLALFKSTLKNKPDDTTPTDSKSEDKKSDVMPLSDVKSTELQTLFLTVTLSQKVNELLDILMKEYESVEEKQAGSYIEMNEMDTVAVPSGMRQKYIVTEPKTKLVTLAALMIERSKIEDCKMFIFMDTRHMVDYHEILFKKCLIKNKDNEDEDSRIDIDLFRIHGSMEQRERMDTFKQFRKVKRGILLCTDSVSRGIDILDSDYVVQYTAATNMKTYIHRIGRTARAGKRGTSLIFVTPNEIEYVTYLKRERNIEIEKKNEEAVLNNLVQFLNDSSIHNSQEAATALQRRFEEAVENDTELQNKAYLAYSSWSSYYRTYHGELRQYFNSKNIHQGHYLTSFAIRKTPAEFNKSLHKQIDDNQLGTMDKKINKKLALDPNEGQTEKPKLSLGKRKSTKDLVISEYDSGLSKSKKKKNK